jgi:hypothetical protein
LLKRLLITIRYFHGTTTWHRGSLFSQNTWDDLRHKFVIIFLLEVDLFPFLAVSCVHPCKFICRIVNNRLGFPIHLNKIIVINRLQLTLVNSTCRTSAFALSTCLMITLALFTLQIFPIMFPHGLLLIKCNLPLDPEHHLVFSLNHHILP